MLVFGSLVGEVVYSLIEWFLHLFSGGWLGGTVDGCNHVAQSYPTHSMHLQKSYNVINDFTCFISRTEHVDKENKFL